MVRSSRMATALFGAALLATLAGCYNLLPSNGGGQTSFTPPRAVDARDVAVPSGYRISVVAQELTFPTGIAFDDAGTPYVVESGYAYGEVWTVPRLLKIMPDGSTREVAHGGRNGPWNGVAYAKDVFYIAEGGQLEGGRILRIAPDGNMTAIVQGLPSRGDHHTNAPVVGPDGKVYFAQGTMTNSAVVGEDNAQFGWLKRFPAEHDIPCQDVTLRGVNYTTSDALHPGSGKQVSTGAFSAFGTQTKSGQTISGKLPCNGAIMRVAAEGGPLELVAWGLRNPFGLAFAPDGQLYATENSYDDRGSRPLWGTPDVLWRVTPGNWYGWPDYAEGKPVNQDLFDVPHKGRPQRLLENTPGAVPKPVAVLGVHASSDGLDFSRNAAFGHVGEAFIAEFGDQAPTTGKSLHPVGFRVIRVDTQTGRIEDFAVNRVDSTGPASKVGGKGLERPLAVRFNPAGDALYVVDFGVLLQDKQGAKPQKGTGVVWKITRETAR